MISPHISVTFVISFLILKILGPDVIDEIITLKIDGIIVAILILIMSSMAANFILTRFIEVV